MAGGCTYCTTVQYMKGGCSVHTVQLYIWQEDIVTVQCPLSTVGTVHSVQSSELSSAQHTLRCALCTVHCASRSVQCAVCSVHGAEQS